MDTLLDEYAVRFYGLLEQSFRIDADEAMERLAASSFPFMEPSGKERLVRDYERRQTDILAEGGRLNLDEAEGDPDAIRKIAELL